MQYKYLFFNDYSEGTHPEVLNLLQGTNLRQEVGYGLDSTSQQAIELIKDKIKNNDIDIHFVGGGTQANLTVLASLLKPYESVIATEQSHISVHEAGAIEATGHKINIVKSSNGKLNPSQVEEVLDAHTDEHMVKPKVVFISQATEIGSVYNKTELEELFKFCKQKDLYLYLDGARLGSAIASEESNMTLKDVA